ncbi:DNA polymerase I [Spirochaetia bacterium]|nr:DNA polymerase I [Spirochaetia bacterium]
MKLKPLYLIDAYAQIYRAYFAFMSRPLRNSEGKNVSALFGFARMILNLIDQLRAERMAVIFDSSKPTFRHEQYPEYKAKRQKAPEDLHSQVPLVREFLDAAKITAIAADGYEADDIIATLAEKCRAQGRDCYIISGDKDLLQLVGNGIWEMRPPKYELAGIDEVKAAWGVPPEKILDLLSLTGDASDNIPGVRGVGEKTAAQLITRYGSLDEIYKNIAGIQGAVSKKLALGKESAYLSKHLITLVNDVPLQNTDIESFSIENMDRNAAAKLLLREEIPSIAKEFSLNIKKQVQTSETAAQETANNALSAALNSVNPELLGKGSYKIAADIEELKQILDEAAAQGFLALDFETDSLDALRAKPVGISISLKPKTAFYVPIGHTTETDVEHNLDEEKVRALLSELLLNPKITVIAHNAKYDYEVTRGWGLPRWKAKIWDTMIAAWLCESDRSGFSLEVLAASYLGDGGISYKSIVSKDETFAAVPLETATRYSGEDADFCLRLKIIFEEKLNKINALQLFEGIEMPLLPILAEMEGQGILIEKNALQKIGVEFADEAVKVQAEIWQLVGHEFNIASPKQLQEVLFNERKLKPGKKTKTGYSTDVAVLEELAREDRVPELILRHRTLVKLKSTYVDALSELADESGRLHTSFVQTGTATGRLSSRDPNLQNIPIREAEGRLIRNAFIASPGMTLISADYSQIELVVLAHFSKDVALIDAFKSGKDVHTRTAALIFGIDEENVDASQRRIAKTINFGVMYGMSAFRLAGELNISRHEAAAFIEAYFRTYSGVRAYIDNLIEETEKNGYTQTISGRRRAVPTINSSNKTEKAAACRIAVNTPIQGTAADIVKKAMIDLDTAIAGSPDTRLLLQVHDELILECPEETCEKTAALVRSVMEKAFILSVPLRVSVETGKSWGDFH